MEKDTAYIQCLEITRQGAKNFHYGIRLLKPHKRKALSALYALARKIDDIADGNLDSQVKLEAITDLRQKIQALASGQTQSLDSDPALWGVYYAAQEFSIPFGALEELLDGCEGDIRGVSYNTMEETVVYCRLVAGTIGRLSLSIFGSKNSEQTPKMADDLGVALQLTNILRDIKVDREDGRTYLPLEDIEKFGCEKDLSGPKDAVAELILFESRRALEWYTRGFELLNHLDHRSKACVGAMSGIYFQLLKRIQKNPHLVLRERVSVPTSQKFWIMGKSLAGLKP